MLTQDIPASRGHRAAEGILALCGGFRVEDIDFIDFIDLFSIQMPAEDHSPRKQPKKKVEIKNILSNSTHILDKRS